MPWNQAKETPSFPPLHKITVSLRHVRGNCKPLPSDAEMQSCVFNTTLIL